ncbi:MAG: ABC transporter permease [Candidatus Eisenbacteria bacterium]
MSAQASTSRAILSVLRSNRPALAGAVILIALCGLAVLAPFVAPYPPERQERGSFFCPPVRLHFVDKEGRFHVRPFVYSYVPSDTLKVSYVESEERTFPVRYFVKGEPYRLFGIIRSTRHLFGVDAHARIFLLGTDQLGRDLFSRLLYGGRASLTIGVIGVALSFALGILVGSVSGYLGGVVDVLSMRVTEIVMSLPVLYLILAARAAFPLNLSPQVNYLLIVLILGLVGWAPLARIVRGMVMSARESDYVRAAVAVGASPARVLSVHILPNISSFLVVAATLAVPGYILAEVALSFLGFGIQEPAPSWGNMLRAAQSTRVLASFPWVVSPGVAVFLAIMALNLVGDAVRDALDPRRVNQSR